MNVTYKLTLRVDSEQDPDVVRALDYLQRRGALSAFVLQLLRQRVVEAKAKHAGLESSSQQLPPAGMLQY